MALCCLPDSPQAKQTKGSRDAMTIVDSSPDVSKQTMGSHFVFSDALILCLSLHLCCSSYVIQTQAEIGSRSLPGGSLRALSPGNFPAGAVSLEKAGSCGCRNRFGIPCWGRRTTRTYFSGDWDVHWGYGLVLTHSHVIRGVIPENQRSNLRSYRAIGHNDISRECWQPPGRL